MTCTFPDPNKPPLSMFAYWDATTGQVVILRKSQAEVGRLSPLEAESFGQEVLAASRGEETGCEPDGDHG